MSKRGVGEIGSKRYYQLLGRIRLIVLFYKIGRLGGRAWYLGAREPLKERPTNCKTILEEKEVYIWKVGRLLVLSTR